MSRVSRLLPASAIAAALAGLPAVALAQDQQPQSQAAQSQAAQSQPAQNHPAQNQPGQSQGAGAPGQDHDDRGDHWREHHGPMAGQLVEARIAYIKTALRITPAQTTAFNAVADLMRQEAKERDAKMAAWQNRKPDDRPHPDPIQMLEHRQKMLEDAAVRVGEMIAAWKPLYDSLSDSQKQMLPVVLGHHDHHGWGHDKHW